MNIIIYHFSISSFYKISKRFNFQRGQLNPLRGFWRLSQFEFFSLLFIYVGKFQTKNLFIVLFILKYSLFYLCERVDRNGTHTYIMRDPYTLISLYEILDPQNTNLEIQGVQTPCDTPGHDSMISNSEKISGLKLAYVGLQNLSYTKIKNRKNLFIYCIEILRCQ